MPDVDLTNIHTVRFGDVDAAAVLFGDVPALAVFNESRRNLVPSPRGIDLSRYNCSSGFLTSIAGGGGILYTRTGTGAARVLEIKIGAAVAGQQVGVKFEMNSPIPLTLSFRATTTISTEGVVAMPPNPPATAGAWLPVERYVSIPASGPEGGFVLTDATGNAGQLISFRNVHVAIGAGPVGSFYDGDTPADLNHRYEWTGPANNSPSRELLRAA